MNRRNFLKLSSLAVTLPVLAKVQVTDNLVISKLPTAPKSTLIDLQTFTEGTCYIETNDYGRVTRLLSWAKVDSYRIRMVRASHIKVSLKFKPNPNIQIVDEDLIFSDKLGNKNVLKNFKITTVYKDSK